MARTTARDSEEFCAFVASGGVPSDRRRSSWRRRHGFHERPVERLAEPVQADPAGATVLHEALWACLQTLPPSQRTAIVLRHYVDLTEAQTADAMGCSIGTVKSCVSTGLERLRSTVGADLEPLPSDDQVVRP